MHHERGHVLGEIGDAGDRAFSEEGVDQGAGLLAEKAFGEELGLAMQAFFKGQSGRGPDRLGGGEGRGLMAQAAGRLGGDAIGEVAGPLGVERLDGFIAGATGPGAGAGEGESGVEQVRDDRIDEAELKGAAGVDRLAEDAQIEGGLEANQPRQALGAAGARDQAELHFGLAEARVGVGDAIVAGEGQLETAAEGGAVKRHDDGLGRVLDLIEERIEVDHRALAGNDAPEFLDVGAGDESAARAGDDNGVDSSVGLGGAHGFYDAFGDAGRERVDGRVIDGDNEHAFLAMGPNEFTHGCTLLKESGLGLGSAVARHGQASLARAEWGTRTRAARTPGDRAILAF